MSVDKIEQAIDMVEQGERPSYRPTAQVKGILTKWDEAEAAIRELQKQMAVVQAALRPVQALQTGYAKELEPLLEDYRDRTAKLGSILAKIEITPARRSAKPSYADPWKWALAKLKGISEELYQEGLKVEQEARKMFPEKKGVVIRREEALGGAIGSAFGRLVDWWTGRSEESWAQIDELDADVDAMLADEGV